MSKPKTGAESGYSIRELGAKKSQYTINKKKLYEETYNEDYFEYRLNKDKSGHYLYCPFTGETIMNAHETFYRTQSFWGQIDGEMYSRAQSTVLYPEVYASRIWGRRKFSGWNAESKEGKLRARIHMQSVARGFIARARLRNYFHTNFQKILDRDSLFYYFVHIPTGGTSWQKPLLATNQGIPIMEPNRFNGFSSGPVVARDGIGKANVKRANYLKDKTPEKKKNGDNIPPVDFDNDSYMTIQYWLDEYVQKMPKYDDCVLAFKVESWRDLYHCISSAPDDQITQFYCIFKGSIMKVKLDVSGILDSGCADYFNYILNYLKKGLKMKYGCPIMQFVCYAILNIIQSHPGRNEFYRTDEISMQLAKGGGAKKKTDEDRLFENAMIEKYIEARLDLFCKYLARIPVEIDVEYLGVGSVDVAVPTNVGCEMVELIVSCIALLAHYKKYREITAYYCSKFILQVMKICSEQMHILCLCLKCLYNFIYWCESAHMYLLESTDLRQIVRDLRSGGFGSEPEIQRDCRKLELALEPDGWRGNIEDKIGEEMREERAQSMYITDKDKYFANLHAQKILDFEIQPGSEYDLPYAPVHKHFEPAPVTSRSVGKHWIKVDNTALEDDPLLLPTVPVTQLGAPKVQAAMTTSTKAATDSSPDQKKKKVPAHMSKYLEIVKDVSRLGSAMYFITPVDPIALGIPDYPQFITQPMDFGTIRMNIEDGTYNSPEEVAANMRLVFRNAFTYYKVSSHKMCIAARKCQQSFEDKFRIAIDAASGGGGSGGGSIPNNMPVDASLNELLLTNNDTIVEGNENEDDEHEDDDEEQEEVLEPGVHRRNNLDIFQQAALPRAEANPRFSGIMLQSGKQAPVTLGDINDHGFIKLPPKDPKNPKNLPAGFFDTPPKEQVKELTLGHPPPQRGVAAPPARQLFTPAAAPPPRIKSLDSKMDLITKKNNVNMKR